jgi:ATP-dependent Clp protease ATP-binding subunit ClpC
MVTERFTQRAIKALMVAKEKADRLDQPQVGIELLLVGVVQNIGPGIKLLQEKDASADKIQAAVMEQVGLGEGSNGTVFAPTLEVEAFLSGLSTTAPTGDIDTPQLLIALLSNDNVRKIFEKLSVDPSEVKAAFEEATTDKKTAKASEAGTTAGQPSQKKPTLEEYGTDLTQRARDGELEPVVGREKELRAVIEILAKRTKKNPVLLGEPGVGKTAIAEGLAQMIANGSVHPFFHDKRIFSIDLGEVLAGTKYRGEFEERLKAIVDEAQDPSIILMIDEIHTLVGAGGGGGGAMDAANILKPGLARGELRIIGATTIEEYRKYVEKDKALERRLTPVEIEEPSVDESVEILRGTAWKDEVYHEVNYTDEALVACAKLASQYIPDRFLPDKAFDVRDEAGAKVQLRKSMAADDAGAEPEWGKVTVKDIEEVVAKRTGVPVEKVSLDESARLLQLEETLHNRVIGQEEAVVAVSKAVRRSRAGMKDPKRPVASFIFSGPTGVGKTELCKALAASYYGKEDAMIRLDMSEFMEPHTIAKLIGSPPGYVGYDDANMLTDSLRRRPYSLVLFDEIEKAHPDIFNIMLQILEDGHLTDSKGRTVSFQHAMIIMTSNIGADAIQKGIMGGGDIGFSVPGDDEADASYQRLKSLTVDNLKSYFRPEFLNRLDDIIVFKSLSKTEVNEIAELEFSKTFERCKEEHGVSVELTDQFKQKVLKESYDPLYGARPLRRAIQRMLEDYLAESFLQEEAEEGERIVCDLDEDGEITILRHSSPPEPGAGEREVVFNFTT